MEVDASHAIFEVEVPKEWIGKTVGKLDIRKKYDINIMAVKDDGKVSMAISADTCFKEDVTLLVLGEYKAIKKVFFVSDVMKKEVRAYVRFHFSIGGNTDVCICVILFEKKLIIFLEKIGK